MKTKFLMCLATTMLKVHSMQLTGTFSWINYKWHANIHALKITCKKKT